MILTCLALAAVVQMNQPADNPGKLEAPLTFQAFDKVDEMTTMYMGARNSSPTMADRSTRIKQYTVPKTALTPVLYRPTIDGKQYAVVAGKSKASLTSFDLLWVDWNGDKVFSDDEQAKPLPKPKSRYDEMLTSDAPTLTAPEGRSNTPAYFVPKSFDGEVKKVMLVVSDTYLQLMPGGIMTGTVSIGKDVKIGVCDSNMNGSYGDAFREEDQEASFGDLLFIDWNGNGKFDGANMYASAPKLTDMETLPFMGRIQLDGKKFYDIEFDPDGKTVAVEIVPGPYAVLKFVGATIDTVVMTGEKGFIYGTAPDGVIEVPGGAYAIQQVQYTIKTPKGDKWKASVYAPSKTKTNLTAGKETVWKCGLPLSVDIEETQSKQDISFSLNIKDSGGHLLSSLTDAKNKEVPAPTMKITNAQGKLVKTLTFSYG